MKDGICPKCGSTEVYTREGSGYRQFLLLVRAMFSFSAARLYDYVCADCGGTEQYIQDKNVLEKIRQSWQRADGQPKDKRKR